MAEKFSDIKRPEQRQEQSELSKLEVKSSAAEQTAEMAKFDREQTAEKARAELADATKTKPREEKKSSVSEARSHSITGLNRRDAFRSEMNKVRSQLSPSQRALSKVVHNRIVEDASEFLEDTIMRPAPLISGGVVGLVIGFVLYIVAQLNGFPLHGSGILVGFLGGWIIGIIGEIVYRWLRGRQRS